MSEDNKSGRDSVAQRRFRRYHRQAARRRQQEKDDTRFFQAVFSLAGVAAAIAIGIAVMGLTGRGPNPEALAALTDPWLGPFSFLEVMGVALILALGAIYLWRIRRR